MIKNIKNTNQMSACVKSNDWQCVGVATMGGASGVGAAISFFQFRSKQADFYITAGIFDRLFQNQYIRGWGIGVGMSASIMKGIWRRLSVKSYY